MRIGLPLEIYPFGAGDPLDSLPESSQRNYIKIYLEDLLATSVLVEPHYFDRDYLAEFSAFYSVSTRGYPNVCKRFHFFSGATLTRDELEKAAGGDRATVEDLNNRYLGFSVIRPIPVTPFGRTVLKWYEDKYPDSRRIVEKRIYTSHIAGFELKVEGLAWQQQDTGVGACATVALWSALHSSALDEFHAVPTTSEITEAAHTNASFGTRIYPSTGLRLEQICEAIKELGLSPLVQTGDLAHGVFSKERFMSSVAAYVRSGYPVITVGMLEGAGLHAVCVVGFRESASSPLPPGSVVLQDSESDVIYLHDDNIGSNVRCRVNVQAELLPNGQKLEYIKFKPQAPQTQYSGAQPRTSDPVADYSAIIPQTFIVAVHNDMRTSPQTLYSIGLEAAGNIGRSINTLNIKAGQPEIGFNLSTRFIRLTKYIGDELERTLSGDPQILGRTRLALIEKIPPMSLHLGVVRIGTGLSPLIDILYDTTDSDRNHPVFGHIIYDPGIKKILEFLSARKLFDFGPSIEAY